jgi:hypothetical protein
MRGANGSNWISKHDWHQERRGTDRLRASLHFGFRSGFAGIAHVEATPFAAPRPAKGTRTDNGLQICEGLYRISSDGVLCKPVSTADSIALTSG